MNLIAGKSVDFVNNYVQKFIDKAMSLSVADLKAIRESDRNLVECLVLDGHDAKAS
jgi:hypothetical protein